MIILPTKHISVSHSLIGIGALLIGHLERPQTVTRLWEKARNAPEVGSFERFSLALDLLYALGAIELHDDLLGRASK